MTLMKVKSIIWYPASIRLSISFWSKVDSDAANGSVAHQFIGGLF